MAGGVARQTQHHQEGEVGDGGVIRLVVSRPGARRAPAASGSTEHKWIWVSAGGDAFWFGGGLEEAWWGSELGSHMHSLPIS